jgi:ribosomal protein S18 acetylase RimI-like enzyme
VNVQSFASAERFLESTRLELELNEAGNSLMLGLSGRLIDHPEQFQVAPCLKTVSDDQGLVLAALMTPPHNLVVYGHRGDCRQAAAVLVRSLGRGGWDVPGVFGPGEAAAAVAEAWAEATGAQYTLAGRQWAYELREVMVPVPGQGRLRPATAEDLELVTAWHYAFHHEISRRIARGQAQRAAEARVQAGDVFLWEDGQAVSTAMKNRPTGRGISVSLVYTPPELRGRGYARACVGELSRMLLGAGWEYCGLYANAANPIANHVYRRIGYRPVCDYEEYRFEA